MARFVFPAQPARLGAPAGAAAAGRPVAGIAWMLLAATCVTLVGVLVKGLGARLPAAEIASLRAWLMIAVLIPWLAWRAPAAFRVRAPGLLAVRALLLTAINGLGFWVLTVLPLVLVTAIAFAKPLFVTVLAAVFLSERVRLRRGLATLLGFVGVLITLNPSQLTGVEAGMLAAAGAVLVTVCMASSVIIGKQLTLSEDPVTIVVWSNLCVAVLLGLPAALLWVPPTAQEWALLALLAALGFISQQAFLRAYRAAEAGFVAPFEYVRILMAAAAGWLWFAEVPGWEIAAGAPLIIASGLYIAHRETRLAKEKALERAKGIEPSS